MLLSRFWYGVLALALGALVFLLSLATSVYNRAEARAVGQGLSSDSQVVDWYLRADARIRSEQLIPFALSPSLRKALQASSQDESGVPPEAREVAEKALKKVMESATVIEGGRAKPAFDAVFAVDQHGRVVAQLGYDQGGKDFELGGYPIVADALHGFLRDDTLVLDYIYRVVGRPVEYDMGQLPAGAVIGARIVNDAFARELAQRTGAAVAFYVNGTVSARASYDVESVDMADLDQLLPELSKVASDKDYMEKGRSQIRTVNGRLRAQFSRMPGEAWKLGTGYAVARKANSVAGIFGFFKMADDKDKAQANVAVVGLIAVAAAIVGLLFSFLEHTRPLQVFRAEASRLAKGHSDQLQPSRFRGAYRKIASDLNDGMELIAAKGGAPRRAADLSQVLGGIPDQPQMSAFSLPGDGVPTSSPIAASGEASRNFPKAAAAGAPGNPPKPPAKRLPRAPGAAPQTSVAEEAGPSEAELAPTPGADQQAEWREVYNAFVATKQQCGESVDGFTFEKFQETLRKNRDALIARHGASHVKFSVYVKDGRAALKANPIRG
ncbi:MAG: MXAN_5187 C-terminal domain-containing protein [Polyangiaceae bacterium]|nr:MXAN_5187 C-terminal domain-containing protein [Polyangiaceae bacterium]